MAKARKQAAEQFKQMVNARHASRKLTGAKYLVEQSEQSRIWYVRDAETGEVFEERETKHGAQMAARRRETQYNARHVE